MDVLSAIRWRASSAAIENGDGSAGIGGVAPVAGARRDEYAGIVLAETRERDAGVMV